MKFIPIFFYVIVLSTSKYLELDMNIIQRPKSSLIKIVNLKSSEEIEVILNRKSHLFTVNLSIGSNQEELTVIIDTGSTILWLPSSKCYKCSKQMKKFEESLSFTYKNLTTPFSISYADGSSTKGFISQEKLQFGSTTIQLQFLLSYEIKNEIDGTSGILGLGIDYYGEESASIIKMLLANNQISKQIFSQKFGKENGKMFIGDYAPEIINNFDNFTNCSLPKIAPYSHAMWSCYITHFFTGYNYMFNKTIAIKNISVLFDSGTNFIIMDTSIEKLFVKSFFREYFKKNYCYKQEEYFLCNTILHKLHFPPIYFIINEITYRIDGKDLFYNHYSYTQLRIIFSNVGGEGTWILGQPFLQNYHVVYDMDAKMIGFHGGQRFNATDYRDYEAEPEESGIPVINFIVISFIVLIFAVLIIFKIKSMRDNRIAQISNNRNVNNVVEPLIN